MSRVFSCLTTFSLLAVLVGCGGGTDLPETVAVSGTVTLNGDPLEGAQISFMPASGKGRGAFATSAADGAFSASTFSNGDGVIPGEYKVTIVKYSEPETDEAAQDVSMDSEEYTGAPEQIDYESEIKNLLPDTYENADRSGLKFEFKSGEPKTDLKLELSN